MGVGLDPKRRVPVVHALRVREHAKLGVYVEGLVKQPVKSLADVEAALERGMALRAVAETAMNAESSRSHAVVQLSAGRSLGAAVVRWHRWATASRCLRARHRPGREEERTRTDERRSVAACATL